MFRELAATYQSKFHSFKPFSVISDRAGFGALDENWKTKTIALAESFAQYQFPNMLASEFMTFCKTGNRVDYETKFFKKRQVLDALILAECVEDKGRFLPAIIDGIFSICEESAWQLPAHNTYIRDTPQHPLPDTTRPVLDLFACETGAILATALYLLKDRLDAVSPFISTRILDELEKRIYRPYITEHFWWMGRGEEPMCNWTIWCTQNVLLSFFLTGIQDEETAASIFKKACGSVDFFLKDYGEDGCCDEGAQYYRHSGLCLFNTIEVLNAITDNYFLHLYEEPKIRNIAAYIYNVHVEDIYYINFADCSPVAGRCSAREFLFAKKTALSDMQAFAAADFLAGGDETLLLPNENNLYYRLQNAFAVAEITAYKATTKPAPNVFYPSVGQYVARNNEWCLAFKCGDNGDSHNHNDTGSFTIYKNGLPFLIDVGVESYTQKTFSPRRYEIWTMQSAYHNLPTINDTMQQDGEAFHAELLEYSLEPSDCHIVADIAGAYPEAAKIKSYLRKAALTKQGVTVEDSFDLDGTAKDVTLNLLTYEKPSVLENTMQIQVGTIGKIQISGCTVQNIEEIAIKDPRLMQTWKHNIYRIQLIACEQKITLLFS